MAQRISDFNRNKALRQVKKNAPWSVVVGHQGIISLPVITGFCGNGK